MKHNLPIMDRIIARSEPRSECLEWLGACTPNGYGQIRVSGRTRYVHVMAYEASHGRVPKGMMVRHRCDNPPCWKLDHLVLGTASDNSADMVARGRWRGKGGITSSGFIKRSWQLDPDMVAWLTRKGKESQTSGSAILRQIVQAAMDADKPKRARVA